MNFEIVYRECGMLRANANDRRCTSQKAFYEVMQVEWSCSVQAAEKGQKTQDEFVMRR